MSQPSTIDVIPPFDPTAYTEITAAQLEQLVAGLIPYTDKGLPMTTSDIAGIPQVPDANTNPKWQKYIWIRVSATSVGVYVWNPSAVSDVTYLQWQSITISGIGVGALVNYMYASNSIDDSKISSVNYSKLTGTPSGFTPSGSITAGDLAGSSYPSPVIANGAVTGAKIAAATITHTNIATSAVQVPTDILPSTVSLSLMRTNSGATANEYYVPPAFIATAAATSLAGNGLKALRVNSGATDIEAVTANGSGFGRILQEVYVSDSSADTTALTGAITTLPVSGNNAKLAAALLYNFTPLSASSTVYIEALVNLTNGAGTNSVHASLYVSAGSGVSTNAIAAVAGDAESASRMTQLVLRYAVASGSVLARTYQIGFGGASNNTRYNSTDGATKLFGGTLGVNSFLRITEYI